MKVTIYHNPGCSQSRRALELIREAGLTPTVVEYLVDPPSEVVLADLVRQLGLAPRDLMRAKEPIYAELGLHDPKLSDAQVIAAMAANPILINRPIVVTPHGAKLCRPPPETVRELLSRN